MAGVSIEITGIEALLARMEFIKVESAALVEQAVVDSALDGQSMAMDLSAVLTGYFRSRWQVQPGDTKLSRNLVNDADYAKFLIFGHHTRSGSWVPPQDCLTPALVYGRKRLVERLFGVMKALG